MGKLRDLLHCAQAPPVEVHVHPVVLEDIERECLQVEEVETGGPLLGRVERSWDGQRLGTKVILLATVAPAADVDGEPAAVTLGGQQHGVRSAAAARWWSKVTGEPLLHLGDWHLHPAGLPGPSSGDERTAQEMVDGSPSAIWLVGIALAEASAEHKTDATHRCWTATQTSRTRVEVRMLITGSKRLKSCRVIPDYSVPALPPLPWEITDPARLAVEVRLLHAAGWTVCIAPPVAGVVAGATLRLRAANGAEHVVFTPVHFPHESPELLDGDRISTPKWTATQCLADLLKENA